MMMKNFFIFFSSLLVVVAPINAFLSISSLYMHPGWLGRILEGVAGILNYPTVLLLPDGLTGFLNNPDVDWTIPAVLLSIPGSLLWALVIAITVAAVLKKQGVKPAAA